jgi:hypothetical protein
VTATEPQPKFTLQSTSGEYETKVVVLEPRIGPA